MNPKAEDRGAVLKFLNRHRQTRWGSDPADLDRAFLADVLHRMKRFFGPGRYFRVTAHGFEGLPDAPCLLVSNHSGGTSIPDVWGFGWAWYQHFGPDRTLHALAHEMVFSLNGLGRFFARIGVLRAAPHRGMQVLTEFKRDLLVMPGGDHDTWRPFGERYKVHFYGRKGYAKLSLRTGAPIVPVANAGAHQSLIVLTDGQSIARRLRLKRVARTEVFPVHLSFPWGLGVGPLPHLPPPTHLRYRLGEPIYPEPVEPGAEPSQAQIDALDAQVRAAVQGLLDQLKADRAQERTRVRQRGRSAAHRAFEHAQRAWQRRVARR